MKREGRAGTNNKTSRWRPSLAKKLLAAVILPILGIALITSLDSGSHQNKSNVAPLPNIDKISFLNGFSLSPLNFQEEFTTFLNELEQTG